MLGISQSINQSSILSPSRFALAVFERCLFQISAGTLEIPTASVRKIASTCCNICQDCLFLILLNFTVRVQSEMPFDDKQPLQLKSLCHITDNQIYNSNFFNRCVNRLFLIQREMTSSCLLSYLLPVEPKAHKQSSK